MTCHLEHPEELVIQARRLRAAGLVDPVGLHDLAPRLTWTPTDGRPGAAQTAYEIEVASSPERLAAGGANRWQSGRMASVDGGAVYAGAELGSRDRCCWRVRLWDADGVAGPWSEPAHFEIGLLQAGDWDGAWIGAPSNIRVPVPRPAPVAAAWPDWTTPDGATAEEMVCRRPIRLRRDFTVGDAVSARLYVAVRGLAAVSLNGSRVGAAELAPGWVDHRTRLLYDVHDVTDLLVDGGNAIGMTLADGWFSGRVFWRGQIYGQDPSCMAQLVVEHADGTTTRVVTDTSWQVAPAPELWADLMMGEARDLRLQEPGWDCVGGGSNWQSAIEVEPPSQRLVCYPGPATVVYDEMSAAEVTSLGAGRWLVDLGQNIAGRARLVVRGAGDATVVVRHGEMLDRDGSLYTQNLRTAAAIDVYLLEGADEVVLEPRFTTHGFRWIEVSGLPAGADVADVTGVVLSSDVDEVGTFACSSPLVNRLFDNVRWSRRGNTVGLMTDCPQRDERLGWMGDALVFLPTAMWLADLEALVTRWYDDVLDGLSDRGTFQDIAPVVEDAPYLGSSPGWADAGVLVPWLVYERYGTTNLLRRGFDAMMTWVRAVAADNPDGLWQVNRGNDYGDWLSVEEKTPKEVLATARHAWTLGLVARAADVLERPDDATWCRDRRAVVVDAFRHAYVTPSGRVVGHTQTAYVLALAFDLLPTELRKAAAGYLRELILDDRGFDATFAPGHLTTGILGVVHVMDVLTDIGEVDLAYRLLENETYPSWGHQIVNGATTLWERWDGWTPEAGFQTPAMNSFNHTSLGAVGQWLFTTVAGIRPASPGFAEVIVAPRPGGSLTWAEATYLGPRGLIRSRWDRDGDKLDLEVEIPCGTTARVVVPGGHTTLVEAGHHCFTATLP